MNNSNVYEFPQAKGIVVIPSCIGTTDTSMSPGMERSREYSTICWIAWN